MIDMTDRPHIAMRLRTLEFRFRHASVPLITHQ